MTQQPFSASALRGAVDLSSLAGPAQQGSPARPGSAAGPQAPGADPSAAGAAVQEATDASFSQLVGTTMSVPAVLVLWAEQMPESRDHVALLGRLAADYDGRFRVLSVELAANPGVMQALTPVLQQAFGQITSLPVVIGLLSGQPLPFYLGPQAEPQVRQVLDKFLEAAVANGVTGRVDLPDAAGPEQPEEPELPETHQRAHDAIDRGDLDGAADAFRQAIQDDPGDEEARLGLAQVDLLRRTADLDPAAVRARAAENPTDVTAQIDAADLDLAGGHVEDAFSRLVATVRVTAGEERNAVREHLLGLFEVVGSHDPRVGKARQALMAALY